MLHSAIEKDGDWIGYTWRGNRLLGRIIEGNVEGRVLGSLALPGGKQPTPVRRMMGRGMDW